MRSMAAVVVSAVLLTKPRVLVVAAVAGIWVMRPVPKVASYPV